MFDIEILEALKRFIQREVAKKIMLEKPLEENEVNGKYVLVNPEVYIGWLLPEENIDECLSDIPQIPAIIINEENGIDDDDESKLNINIEIITYDPGTRISETETNLDSNGYKDVLNVISKIRLALSSNLVIEEITTANKPFKWNIPKNQPYPYWIGFFNFSVSTIPLNIVDISKECKKFL